MHHATVPFVGGKIVKHRDLDLRRRPRTFMMTRAHPSISTHLLSQAIPGQVTRELEFDELAWWWSARSTFENGSLLAVDTWHCVLLLRVSPSHLIIAPSLLSTHISKATNPGTVPIKRVIWNSNKSRRLPVCRFYRDFYFRFKFDITLDEALSKNRAVAYKPSWPVDEVMIRIIGRISEF